MIWFCTVVRAVPSTSELWLKVNCRLKVNCSIKFGLAWPTAGRATQLFSYNCGGQDTTHPQLTPHHSISNLT